MKREDRKSLAIAIAVMLVLGASGSANALTISSLGGSSLFSSLLKLKSGDLKLTAWNYDDGGSSDWDDHEEGSYDRYSDSQWSFSSWREKRGDCDDTRPVPEPSAAVVFGLGLLVACQFSRRAR